MVKKKTSIVIDEEVWLEFKLYCIKNKIDMSEYLEKLIKEGTLNKKEKKKRTLEDLEVELFGEGMRMRGNK